MSPRPLLALLLLTATAAAQDAAQEYEKKIRDKAKQVLGQCTQALGGQRFFAIRNRVEEGMLFSFYREEMNGLDHAIIYVAYDLNPAPGKLSVRERESFGRPNKKKEEFGAELFTRTEGYEITWRGARPLNKQTFDRYRDSTLHDFFYILLQRYHEPGMIFECSKSDIVDNRPADIVDITDPENRVTSVYIDQFNHLPLRQVYRRRNEVTKDFNEEVTIFAKYRDVGGGVMWPFDITRTRDGERVFQKFATSVKINQDLPESLFTLPSGIDILKSY
jgi:hypothetical protein